MINSAVKRSLDEVEYKQHAWIDDDPRGAFVDGMHYLPRPYEVGDRIALDNGDVEVVETFNGFHFHSGEPVRCFEIERVCPNCRKVGVHQSSWYGRFNCEVAA